MSAIVYYQPTEDCKVLKKATSSFVTALREVFGEFPIELGLPDLPVLRGMAIACEGEPYHRLVEVIETRGRIKVWVEY